MSLIIISQPATEPVTIAELMAHLRIDSGGQEPAPGAPSAALVSPPAAGNIDNGAHRYLVTFVTADGETQAGTSSAIVTVADKTVNGKVLISGIPVGGSAVTARKLYRTLAGGSTYYLLATIADNSTTSYTDNIADGSLGAGAPSSNTTGDPLLTALIISARQQAEHRIGRALITQTLEKVIDAFSDDIQLSMPPVIAITSVKYLDENGIEQTLAADQYSLDKDSEPGWLTPAYGVSWPSTYSVPNAVRVRYTAGYGAASAVPQSIKTWILMAAATMYSQREGIVTGVPVAEVPRDFFAGLLDPYRIIRF